MDEVYFKKPFYIAGSSLEDMHPHEIFDNSVKSKIDGYGSSYPDVKFIHLKNGINVALSSSSSNKEISIVHPSGTYVYIDTNGKVKIKSSEINLKGEKVIITGGELDVNGTASPTGSGPFCGLPNCLFTGSPQTSAKVTGT